MKRLTVIARYHGPLKDKFGLPRQSGLVSGLPGRIVMEEGFRDADAFRSLEDFERIWLIWGFHGVAARNDFRPLVRPPRLGGNRHVGVFASRSPFRPNGLGLSCVRLRGIRTGGEEGPVLLVEGADLMDGTPIYDIKPYIPYADSFPDAAAGFVDETVWEPLEVAFPEALQDRFIRLWDTEGGEGPAPLEAVAGLLAQDPRPSYQDDPQRTYGMQTGPLDVRFRVIGNKVDVLSIEPYKHKD